jgi:hypothetical protein
MAIMSRLVIPAWIAGIQGSMEGSELAIRDSECPLPGGHDGLEQIPK